MHDRNNDKLRQALYRLQRVVVLAAVPAAHHKLALIIGVDEADEIAEHDAVLVAQARARQNQRG